MIIEIGTALINTDNLLIAAGFYKTDSVPAHMELTFKGVWKITIPFDSNEALQVAYQTLKLCETVVKLKK